MICIFVLTSWPHLHTDLQQIPGAVRSPLMLQTLHHHPRPPPPKKLHDLMTTNLWLWRLWSWNNLKDWFWLISPLDSYWTPCSFSYRAIRSVDDAVKMGLHFILQHLDRPGTYVKILFVDFSSAFNTIIPDTLQNKLIQLSVPTSVCQWINSFLIDKQQLVRKIISSGAPQGCVLSPLLFSLYMNDCTSKDPSVKLLKFADDTTLKGLIQDGDESAYGQEVKELSVWCSLNNLELNTLKTVEMTVDFRRNPPALSPLTVMNSTVTAVESFRFLGTTISQDLKWDNHIESIVKKAQQRLFLRQLRKFNPPQELLIQFYSAIIESVLCTSITVWFSSATKSDLIRLRRVVRTAERLIGTTLPILQELYLSRVN